jgi:hypothetical protein
MPDSSKSLIATATLCLLVVCSTLKAQDTPEVPEASSISNAKPTLAELMVRFAEIEAGYLPFHIEYRETGDVVEGPYKAGLQAKSKRSFQYLTQRGHQGQNVWMCESTNENEGVSRTERLLWQDSKLHRRETAPALFMLDSDESIENLVRPLEGIFPLLFGTKSPIRVSEHFAAAPSEFTWEWREELARVMCHYRPKNDKHIAVELWLDPDYGWHPVFMRRYEIHTGERFPDEWKALQFLRLADQVRISLGDFNGPIRGGKVSTDEFSQPFIRSRFEILKSAYQNRVAAAAFSPDTPIGGSPIVELEPVGGEQLEVKSSSIAELSPPALTPEQILAFAAVTNQQSATEMRPAASLNPSNGISAGENSPPKNRRLPARSVEDELLKTYLLQNIEAQDSAKVIEQMFDDRVTVAVDERTNSLIVRTQEALHQQIESLLFHFDNAPNTATLAGGVTGLTSPDASKPPVAIAEFRRRLANLEKPVVQLGEKVRAVETSLGKDHPDAIKQRAELRVLVQKTFAERQEIQRAELAEFTRRLQRMQHAIETREKVAEKIVDRRVEELLHSDNSTESNSRLLYRTALPLSGSHDDVNTSALTAPPGLITKTYPVGNYATATFFDQAIALQNPAPSLDAAADSIRQKAEELITQISSHNKPAAISFDSARLQLVVSHTAEGHRALGELFATIKLPMQEQLTFSRCEVNEQIYSAFKDSPVWTAFDEFRNKVEDGGWIGVRKNEFVKWFERVLKESPAGENLGQPTVLVLAAGVPYQFDAGEIRVTLTARINPATQKPQLRIDYTDLSGRPSGTRMISDLEDLAVWIPPVESITFLVYESAQGGSFPRHDQSMENPLNDPNAALRPKLQGVTGETTADQSFVRGEVPPTSDAEKSVGRLVLVFANDAARRMVPALMVKHGERTLALTVGPATIVPDDTPHAIDRTFLEFYNRDDVPTEYSQELEFPDLRAYEAKESLTEFQHENPVTVELSDQLSAIINHGQADFKVTSRAARVTALEQSTTWELPSHNVTREFRGLIQIDQRLPEGTPLFRNGELAGITLLGTRFMKDDIAGSYVVPASRIFEVLRQVETK